MKKFFTILTVILALAVIAAPSEAGWKDMWAYVYSWDGKLSTDGKPVLTRLTSGVTFQVLRADYDTEETLYEFNDNAFTSLTNPVTTTNFASATVCNDRVAFRVDPTDSGDEDVDLIVVDTSGGYTLFVEDFNQYIHTLIIDERPNILHHGVIWFTAATAETDTGIDFDYDTMIHDVRIEVITASSGTTLNVGLLSSETSGDLDGFLAEAPLTNTGYRYDSVGAAITRVDSSDRIGQSWYGALLASSQGATTTYSSSAQGNFRFYGHIVESANAVSLVYNASAAAGEGYIHYWFTRLR